MEWTQEQLRALVRSRGIEVSDDEMIPKLVWLGPAPITDEDREWAHRMIGY